MLEGESASGLHARIKDILNGLHAIGERVDNRDIIRYALKAFPRNTLWASMVDAYKVSRDLNIIKLDEMFSEFELHEQSNTEVQEKGIALIAGSEPKRRRGPEDSEPSDTDEADGNEDVTELVNLVRKMFKNRRGVRRSDIKKMVNTSKQPVTGRQEAKCYGCGRKGHFIVDCPRKNQKSKRKVLKATWDESSSEESDGEPTTSFLALPAQDSSYESDYDSDDESHGSVSVSEGSKSTVSQNKLLSIIITISKQLVITEAERDSLRERLAPFAEKVTSESPTLDEPVASPTRAQLEEENSRLRIQVSDLTRSLEKFTDGSKNLKMMLGSQKAGYNRSGIGYTTKQKSFIALTRRNQTRVQAWVPKSRLVNPVRPNQFLIPKDQVHLVRPIKGHDPGGTRTTCLISCIT